MYLVGGCFVVSTILMQVFHWCKINVFKIVIFMGTFALALAFAGNDLVNFVGVPLAAYSAYQDFAANGAGQADTFMMGSLNESAKTPFIFLFLSGVVMVYALATSKKAHNVVKTSVDLSRQDEGEEMFGSSRVARSIVRGANNVNDFFSKYTPKPLVRWIDARFNKDEAILAQGAAFDLVRASINLVLSGLLIALGNIVETSSFYHLRDFHRGHGVLFGGPRMVARKRGVPHHGSAERHRRMVPHGRYRFLSLCIGHDCHVLWRCSGDGPVCLRCRIYPD